MKKSQMSMLTKSRLAEALKVRMKKTSFEKITVSDLIKDCEVTRQTFYYHFRDIYDLLKWVVQIEMINILKYGLNKDRWEDTLLDLFKYLYQNKYMYNSTHNILNNKQIQDFLFEEIRPLVLNFIVNLDADVDLEDDNVCFVVDFYVGAVIGSMERWALGGMQDAPEKIVNIVSIIINGNILNAIEKINNENNRKL